MLVNIDPGVKGCGVACWGGADNELLCADYVIAEHPAYGEATDMARGVAQYVQRQGAASALVIEFPQAYSRAGQRGDQNDLLRLAAVVGAIEARLGAPSTRYLPRAWKGQIPKPKTKKETYILVPRILTRLSSEELPRVGAGGPHWDTWDAIGIGLKKLGRL